MKILSVNAGSSSLKFTLIELPSNEEIASGLFEKIGIEGSFYTIKYNGKKIEKEIEQENHSVSVSILINQLKELGIVESLEEIDGVGHRLVHGGSEYSESIVLTEEIIKNIEKYNDLAPLHNPANIMGVRAFMEALPGVLNVAVFDTAFHQTMDPEFYMYPVPYSWYRDLSVRKYGFHGTSHKYVNKTISELLGRDNLKVISCHIGNGGSLAAIDAGKVIDTSMGMTPLAGLMMGTRAGDIDAGIIEYMANKTGQSLEDIIKILNKESGLLGISEISSDARDVEAAKQEGNEQAKLAEEMYSRRIANYIAMYNNSLEGADVILFTAGLGENSYVMKREILKRVKSLGVVIDDEKLKLRGELVKVSTPESKIEVYVVPTNEELMIALDTMELKNK
ncbi:MAG: acetate kinase [bacterium]